MENRIRYVTKEEAEAVRAAAAQDKDTFFAEIDGSIIQSERDYVQAMADAFLFPHKLPDLIIGWYNDYIHDLLWIRQTNIIMLIRSFEQMLIGDLDLKKEITLPWWEGEVVGL